MPVPGLAERLKVQTFITDLLAALESENDSEEVVYFCLTHMTEPLEIPKLFVVNNWDLFRNHIPLEHIEIKNKECTVIQIALPAWLGDIYYTFKFYRPSESKVVIDCIDMHMKYDVLKNALTPTMH